MIKRGQDKGEPWSKPQSGHTSIAVSPISKRQYRSVKKLCNNAIMHGFNPMPLRLCTKPFLQTVSYTDCISSMNNCTTSLHQRAGTISWTSRLLVSRTSLPARKPNWKGIKAFCRSSRNKLSLLEHTHIACLAITRWGEQPFGRLPREFGGLSVEDNPT